MDTHTADMKRNGRDGMTWNRDGWLLSVMETLISVIGTHASVMETPVRDMQRSRGGLVFKAHRLCVSLNSRLESTQEEEEHMNTRISVMDTHVIVIKTHTENMTRNGRDVMT